MIEQRNSTINNKKESNLLIYIFHVWTFVLIARPQDFVQALTPVRPALTVGIIVVIFYVFYHALYKHRLLDNQQCRLYLYLLAMMIISIPFAYYPRGAFEFIFTKHMVVVVFFYMFYKLIDNTTKLNNILWIACFATCLYLLIALYKGNMEFGRLQYGDMFDPNDLAFLAVSLLPFNILFISKYDPWWKRLTCLINILTSILIILMTESRGGFIALVIVTVMLLFAKTYIMKTSYKIIIVVFVLIALILGGSAIDFSRLKTLQQIGEDYNVWDETGRLEVWKRGVGLMLRDPLTGVGVSCFQEAIGKERKEEGMQEFWQAPHNSLVQIGTETGILGLILFVLISYNAIRIFGKTKNMDNAEQVEELGEMSKISFVGHLVSSMFLSQAYSLCWAFFIAISAVLTRIRFESVSSVEGVRRVVSD